MTRESSYTLLHYVTEDMIPEQTRIILVDSSARKFLTKATTGMIEVPGLGVVDGTEVCKSDFGDRINIGGREFTILRPSIKDTLGLLERRAQVLIPKDSFQIPLQLDLGCGSRVIEGGVGSGALTLVLLKAVGPEGRVYSYDNREDSAAIARRNVKMSGLEESWEMIVGDIKTAKLRDDVDAAILDIPDPWDALGNTIGSVRVGGYIGCYVPNANQLETTVRKMRELGLMEITSYETLQREMVVHEGGVRPSFDMLGHTGYLAFGRKMRR